MYSTKISGKITMGLATDASVNLQKRVMGIWFMLEGKECDVDFVQLDLIDKFDVILSLSWKVRAINKLIASNRKHVCASSLTIFGWKGPYSWDYYPINVLERLQARNCITSEHDGLPCGTVVSMTTQELSMTNRYIADKLLSTSQKHMQRRRSTTWIIRMD